MPNVVVIDDRVTNRNVLTRLAASVEEGVRVKAFASPQEALDWIRGTVPDLVITDFKMPGMDGADFTRAFRTIPGAADVPVVVVTVYEERSYCYQALEAGATDFLLSPVDHHEFRARARNLLTLRKQQKLLEQRASDLHRELLSSTEQHEAALRASDCRLRRLIDTVPATISAVTATGRITLTNSAHRRLYGIDPGTATGQTLAQVHGEDYATQHLVLNAKVFETGDTVPSFEHEVTRPLPTQEHVLLTTKSPLFDEAGRVTDVVTVSLDVTDLKRAEAQIRHQAGHDALTGLPNRGLFKEYLEHALARARRGHDAAAVLLLDLDRFKGVNDAFGLACGDLLLRAVAERLQAALGDADAIARLGGDEFAILQTEVRSPDDPRALARRLIDSFGQPFVISGEELHTSASIGITMFPSDGQTADRLAQERRAGDVPGQGERPQRQLLLCAADEPGGAPHRPAGARAASGASRPISSRSTISRSAISRPGVSSAVEALLRWRHPRRGMVRPTEFIGLAEDIGLIGPLTERVLGTRLSSAPRVATRRDDRLRLSVNLSPVQFREGGDRQP